MVGNIDGKQKDAIENLTRELVERILQLPAESLRKAALNNDGALLVCSEETLRIKLGSETLTKKENKIQV